MAEAGQLYKQRCSPCHGLSGAGDGPLANNLEPRPRTFADAKWQATTSDQVIEKIIREGGPSVGKSPIMPASPDLVERPEVIRALRMMVRAFYVPPQ
jgi:mono/diheme cytochrome c family protein